jgi:hypothetical protein
MTKGAHTDMLSSGEMRQTIYEPPHQLGCDRLLGG